MPSLSRFRWLLIKEWRALTASKAFWLMLLVTAPLVGLSFINSVRTYSELSVGVGEALDPLVGIWAPTFSAAELTAVFLLPFVVIALVAGDRQSGAVKLELQQPFPPMLLIIAKTTVLFVGWTIAMLIPATGFFLWRLYGGTLFSPEMIALLLGHYLNAALTIALATVASSLAESQAAAAIITLAVTVGPWLINFAGSIQGGWWERAAAFTPSALVAQFQHGLLASSTIAVTLVIAGCGLSLGGIWLNLGQSVPRKIFRSCLLGMISAFAITVLTLIPPRSWDLSESRRNSFPAADEHALLRGVKHPLQIHVHLAAEDPRRQDLESHSLGKLRRLLPALVSVHYEAATATGLFEQASPNYGEIWYVMSGHRTVSRSTTAEGVLEAVYTVAEIEPPAADDQSAYPGHPLVTQPRWAGFVFFGLWPLLIILISLRYWLT